MKKFDARQGTKPAYRTGVAIPRTAARGSPSYIEALSRRMGSNKSEYMRQF